MEGKIGLEEHFAIAETIEDSRGFLGEHIWPELKARLADLHDKRIALMDKHGCKTVKFQVYIKDGKAALKASPVRG